MDILAACTVTPACALLIRGGYAIIGYPECKNASEDLIVLVDEGHRTQGGEANARMRTALPRAAFIAFTGTPLLQDEKTVNKFGAIIHAYTMQQAVRDKAVVPLLYEERQPSLDINQQAIDDCFNAITDGLTDRQKADIKRRFANTDQVYKSDNRLYRIALDISSHFGEYIRKISPGLKGQLAADSKVSAIRYKQHLDALGKVTSAVIISPPDTRENHKKVDDDPSLLPIVQQWYKRTVGKEDPREYEKRIIEDFSTDGAPDILIVVDKLLTGFDEPRNAVLYIDKPMENHEIIQAIARVNRLHPEKQYGFLVDYRGILAPLDTAIKGYQDLATRTQAGYDTAWFCEYCGMLLETADEEAEGACRECLDYLERGPIECGGCYGALTSRVHRELGWCDDCGYDIYGRRWTGMLRHAAESREWDSVRECF